MPVLCRQAWPKRTTTKPVVARTQWPCECEHCAKRTPDTYRHRVELAFMDFDEERILSQIILFIYTTTMRTIVYNYCLFLTVFLALLGVKAQLTNVLGQCQQQANTANTCIQVSVVSPEACYLCVMGFMNTTMMNGFTSMMTGSNSSNTSNSMMGGSYNTTTNNMMGGSSTSNSMMGGSNTSWTNFCHQIQAMACSAMGSCGCANCSSVIESFMDCGINVTAQASSGSSCSSGTSSRKLLSGGMCGNNATAQASGSMCNNGSSRRLLGGGMCSEAGTKYRSFIAIVGIVTGIVLTNL
jgi:hypothetical protein